MNPQTTITVNHCVDVAAIVTIAGTFVGLLPSIATILAIIWYAVQIYGYWREKQRKPKRKR